MANPHFYRAHISWTGASKGPAINYEGYSREFKVEWQGKPILTGSADSSYRGDPSLPNPEDLLVASISSCHMLSFIALAVRARMDVISYEDDAEGQMQMQDGRMRVTDVVLRPTVVLGAGADLSKALDLHDTAHDQCFISNSVKVDIRVEAQIKIQEGTIA